MVLFSIITFYINHIVLLLVSKNSLLIPLFLNMLLIVLYPHFIKKNKLIILGFILGLVFDITYTQTLFVNSILLVISSLIIILVYKYVSINTFNSIILSLIVIIVYRLLSYVIYIYLYNVNFNIGILLKSIYSSILINVMYIIICTNIIKKISNKKRKINSYSYLK